MATPTGNAKITYVTDNVGLVTGNISSGGVGNDTSPTIAGTYAGDNPADFIAIFEGSTLISYTNFNGAKGEWSFTLSGLSEGKHTITTKLVHDDGKGGFAYGPGQDFVYNVDTTAPLNTTTLTSVDGKTSGNTTDTTPTFGGQINGNGFGTGDGNGVGSRTVAIFDNGAYIGQTNIAADASDDFDNWSFTPGTALAAGAHSFTAAVIDAVGNIGTLSSAISMTVGAAPVADTTAPDTSITVNPANPTNSTTANFTFSGSDNVGVTGYEYQIDGKGWTATSGTTKSYTSLTEGSHTFEVRAKDAAGNLDGSPASYTWTVDTTAPDTTFAATPASVASSTTANFSFSGNDGAGSGVASYEYSLDGGAFTAAGGSSKTFTGLGEGSHTVQVRATDGAGNTDATPASYTWAVDTIAPDTTIGTKPAADSNSATANFTFFGNDGAGSGVSSYEYSLDGGAFTAAGGSSKTFTGLGEGSHTFQVRAKDVAGNTDPTPASYTWTVDTIKPAAPTAALGIDTGYLSSDKVTKNGAWSVTNAEAGATVEYKVGAGAWTTVQPIAAEGANSIDIRQTDKAGNISDVTTFSFTVDTTAPDTAFGSTPPLYTNGGSSFSPSIDDGAGSGLAYYETQLDGGAWINQGALINITFFGLTDGAHTFNVRATDKAGNADATPASYTWTVDTTKPVFTSGGAGAVAENTAAATTAYTATATDANGVTLALSGADAAKFDFDAATGKLTFKASPDYETPTDSGTDNVYNVTFTATDLAGNIKTQDVAISVTDLNDKAPVFTSASTATASENTTPATVVYTAATTDADGTAANRGVTYSLEGTDAAKFDINPTTGAVTFKVAPDYELPTDAGGNNVYDVVVKATNVGVDTTQTTTKNVAISVTDVNDNTPVITSAASVNFAENAGGVVYTVTATDADITPAFKVSSYSLAAGGDNDLFNINSTTGAVTFKASPDFEKPLDSDKNNSYVLTVRASDGLNIGTKTVTINVTDLVEDSGSGNTAGLTITSTNATIKDATPLILGSANSAQVGQTVTVFEGTTARGTGVVQANGTWSVETGLVADGAHTYTAQIGSSTSNSVTLTVDTVAPVVTITGTTGTGFSPTVNGTASVADIGRAVSILDGGAVVGTGTVGAGGAFSVTTGLTGTGGHSLTAQVTDLAGNVGTSTATAYTIAPQPAQGDIDASNLKVAYENIMDGPAKTQAEGAYLQDLLNKLALNLVTYKEALDAVIDHADGTTSVATLSYQFFTGKIPTKAGLDYLLTTTGGNANNINSAYYQDFNIENRFINFAVNLGHDGAGKDAFQTKYGALSLFDATKKAYAEIFGTAATDAKVHELLDTSVVLGGKAMARSAYFTAYGHDDVGTKAAMVGWLLSEAAKSDVGAYAKANEAFLSDLADGATFGVDLIGVYGAKPAPLVMQFEA